MGPSSDQLQELAGHLLEQPRPDHVLLPPVHVGHLLPLRGAEERGREEHEGGAGEQQEEHHHPHSSSQGVLQC